MTITPEQAKALLKDTTPAPWKKTQEDLTHPVGYLIEGVLYDCCSYQGAVSDPEADLICAAPDMAEQIAGMRYEYTAQIQDEHGEWKFYGGWEWKVGGDYEMILLETSADTTWTANLETAREWAGDTAGDEIRIVRRLVSGPEVVE